MKVLKFGGTSVADAKNIKQVVSIVNSQKEKPLIVVVSAFSGVTDSLLEMAQTASKKENTYIEKVIKLKNIHITAINALLEKDKQEDVITFCNTTFKEIETLLNGCFLLGELTPRTQDRIAGFGEILSSFIIAETFKNYDKTTNWVDSRKLIITNDNFGKAEVLFEKTNSLIKTYFKSTSSNLYILPGFVAATFDGVSTTLGRGGSDYTAAIVAAALEASILEIWTDVNGMFTANPKLVKQAQPIPEISYEEAMELSHFGAKVLYPPTIQPVLSKNIPIKIKNTFSPNDEGTFISNDISTPSNPIKGISHIDKIALITLEGSGMIGVAGSSKRLFEVLSHHNINVIFITQASSEHSICVGIQNQDAKLAKSALEKAFAFEINQQKINAITLEKDLCIVALVGEQMKNHQGISGKMFSTLGKNNVNIRAIAQGASERNISVVIQEKDVKKALNSLHERFFENIDKQLNLFVMGVGNVGEKFIEQLHKQANFLRNIKKLNIRVVALSNSKTMLFNEEGIDLNHWKEELKSGAIASSEIFVNTTINLNLRNSIFIDITASESVSLLYARFLEKNIAVVTCNKIACASKFSNYKFLKNLSQKYNAPFLFETNVGAGLPIIDTVKNMVASGDTIHKIQAVLSGSLNFIFNNYNAENTFASVVKQAGIEGYTEPDPKIDLSGVDVMRKILILIRESGYEMELDEIENTSFLPACCLETKTVESFFKSVEENESHFKNVYNQANAKGYRLKFVAQFINGKASVGLQEIAPDHPFYNLEGKDNIVLFYSDRYQDQPLLIKGAGAGAAVTASGIFADVIRMGMV